MDGKLCARLLQHLRYRQDMIKVAMRQQHPGDPDAMLLGRLQDGRSIVARIDDSALHRLFVVKNIAIGADHADTQV